MIKWCSAVILYAVGVWLLASDNARASLSVGDDEPIWTEYEAETR